MKPYPLEASNHLMTSDISTRLAAESPSPDKASTAGSRCAPVAYSPGPSLFCPVPPDGGPPSFLDTKSSDPMTPDPTLQKSGPPSPWRDRNTRSSMTLMTTLRESLESKDNTLDCRA